MKSITTLIEAEPLTRPTQSLIVVAQMLALRAMQAAPDHREGYQRAKAAMKPLLAITAGNVLQMGGTLNGK